MAKTALIEGKLYRFNSAANNYSVLWSPRDGLNRVFPIETIFLYAGKLDHNDPSGYIKVTRMFLSGSDGQIYVASEPYTVQYLERVL